MERRSSGINVNSLPCINVQKLSVALRGLFRHVSFFAAFSKKYLELGSCVSSSGSAKAIEKILTHLGTARIFNWASCNFLYLHTFGRLLKPCLHVGMQVRQSPLKLGHLLKYTLMTLIHNF